MKKIFEPLEDGQAHVMRPGEIFFVECCDCGLVHEHVLLKEFQGDQIVMLTERDNVQTAAARRRRRKK